MKSPWYALCLAALLTIFVVGCETPATSVTPNTPPGSCPCQRASLLVFTAPGCGPCRQQAPLVSQIEASGVRVTRIDIAQHPDIAQRYGVTSVPTYYYFAQGQRPLRTQQASDILTRLGDLCRRR